MEAPIGRQGREREWRVIWLATLAVLIIVGGFVAFFRAKDNAEKAAAVRRAENEQLAHAAMIRQENRQSAYAGREVIHPPGSLVGVAVKKRKASKP